MSPTCYNPYHFIPVLPRGDAQRDHDLPRELLGTEEAEETTHERYVESAHSGRLVCRLTTKIPLVVGAEQTCPAGQIAQIAPYMVKARGDSEARPAIPGSSVRGLISGLAEAASNSALRVLTGGAYSYRKPFDAAHTLSALGLIVHHEDGSLQLKPVALPTLQRAPHPTADGCDQYEVPMRFRAVFPEPALKVYMGDAVSIRSDPGPRFRTSQHCQADHQCRVPALKYNAEGNLSAHPSFHCKSTRQHPKQYLVAQDPDNSSPPRAGFLRVLGCWGERTAHIPNGKKHELWLPEPGSNVPTLSISPKAIERFHELADERTEASLKAGDPVMPFHPLDTPRNEDPGQFQQRFRLKAGDLVYFEVDNTRTVIEIALSAIWRGRVETSRGDGAGAVEFFEAVDPELVPFSLDRKRITIAERMFGFVEEIAPGARAGRTEGGLALASRIRFSDALLGPGVSCDAALELEAVPLRILSSPKPPSPALYFKDRNQGGKWIAKQDLKPGEHVPQGRKMYLHHRVKPGARPWVTRHPDDHVAQKNSVRPIRAEQEFHFHVDYDNLTDAELGLLLYALAPNDAFHHKLGMGKPLGLGSVKIEILEWKTVNRCERYSVEGLWSDRFAAVRRPQDEGFWALRDAVIRMGLVPQKIHDAICLLGDIEKAPRSQTIHTPTMADQSDPEEKTYEWFVANDGNPGRQGERLSKWRQFLLPLPESEGELPHLVRPSWEPDDGPRGGRRISRR